MFSYPFRSSYLSFSFHISFPPFLVFSFKHSRQILRPSLAIIFLSNFTVLIFADSHFFSIFLLSPHLCSTHTLLIISKRLLTYSPNHSYSFICLSRQIPYLRIRRFISVKGRTQILKLVPCNHILIFIHTLSFYLLQTLTFLSFPHLHRVSSFSFNVAIFFVISVHCSCTRFVLLDIPFTTFPTTLFICFHCSLTYWFFMYVHISTCFNLSIYLCVTVNCLTHFALLD